MAPKINIDSVLLQVNEPRIGSRQIPRETLPQNLQMEAQYFS